MMIVADLTNGNADAIEDATIGAWELQSGRALTGKPASRLVTDEFRAGAASKHQRHAQTPETKEL